jgi:hypothetical protein
MPINFPDNPSINDTYQVNGRHFVWNGSKWRKRRARVEVAPPSLEVSEDFSAGGSALHVDSTNESVGIGTDAPNASDALTVGGDTTVTGNLSVSGVITVPTVSAATNDTKVATTEYVTTAISNLVGGAPSALDTLNELAAALNDDASYATTITNALALKLDSSSYTAADILTKIKTVDGASSGLDADTLDGSHASAFAASSHTHSYAATSHTHSYLPTSGGTVSGDLAVTGRFQIGGHYIDDVAGSGNPYGSINVGGAMSWDGYAIDQRVVFMHDGSSAWGIYNDVNNEWMIYGTLNGGVELKYNNTTRLWTDNSGGRTTGRHYTDGSNYAYSYYGHSNIAGTGNAIHTPNGIYSTGTNWLYGTILTNGSNIGQTSQYIGTIYANNWFRSSGQTGMYNESYGGGWFMQDTTWVRTYNSKWVYTNGGALRVYKTGTTSVWSDGPLQSQSNGYNGWGHQCASSNTHTGQLRPASGTWYARNYNDGSYWTLAAVIANQSSQRMKQDIEPWGLAKPLSSAVNATYDTTATDLIKQLRPVSYRFKKHERLPRDMDTERRQTALDRLNTIKIRSGEEQYAGEDAIHLCGRDCDGSPETPCFMYQNWERGTIGFIAEEVGEVIPEATEMNLKPDAPYQGENGAIDGLALTAVLTKALQEVEARLAALEASLS